MKAYLDNSATTRPTEGVIAAVTTAMRDMYFNPSSVYAPAVEVFRAVRACREAVLEKLGAQGEKLLFTSGGTEANNLAILGAVARMRGRQVVAVGAAEHPSVRAPFERLKDMGHDVRSLGVDSGGELDWDALEKALQDGASLVSFMQVNNETGALLDCERLYRTVAGRALVHIDGVQGFLRVPFDMKNADMYTLSAHKIHGPKGVGALALRKNIRLEPAHIGGGQEEGLRSGNENTPGIAGLFQAVREMDASGLKEKKLYMVKRFLDAVPEALINGPEPERGAPHILNISFPGVRGETLLHALEAEQVYASTGSACSSKKKVMSPVLTAMGIPPERAECALRFSLSPHTELQEIDRAAEALRDVYPKLRRFQRR
ncbi:MAG: cysteine desulfurase [Clostridiales bacterium]|nr:cysteine desulfurase [Clostridiales bacterium]